VRRPTVADVLEAVTYVAGVDPLEQSRTRDVIRSRRLACHALREITESSYPAIGRALDLDHSTAMHHCAIPPDYEELRAVLERVANKLAAEHRAEVIATWG
jgi:Bacterial dnaA protein helix-turn-helix